MLLRLRTCAGAVVCLLTGCSSPVSTAGSGPTDVSFAADQLVLRLPDSQVDAAPDNAEPDLTATTDTTETLADTSGSDSAADTAQASDTADLDAGPPAQTDASAEPDLSWVEDGFFDPPDDASSDDAAVEPGANAPPWLLTMDNATGTLRKVDIKTGKSAPVCKLAVKGSYPSLTFRRDNMLMASRKGSGLDILNPCTCAVTQLADYGSGATSVNGITSDQGQGLMGVSASLQSLIAINGKTGIAQVIGPLGVKFGANGATWSDAMQGLYAINGADDFLYTIAPKTGVATVLVKLSKGFSSVGVELHPGDGQIYACSDEGVLLQVNPVSGAVTELGDMGLIGACSNLAAPWGPVACVDAVVVE